MSIERRATVAPASAVLACSPAAMCCGVCCCCL